MCYSLIYSNSSFTQYSAHVAGVDPGGGGHGGHETNANCSRLLWSQCIWMQHRSLCKHKTLKAAASNMAVARIPGG